MSSSKPSCLDFTLKTLLISFTFLSLLIGASAIPTTTYDLPSFKSVSVRDVEEARRLVKAVQAEVGELNRRYIEGLTERAYTGTTKRDTSAGLFMKRRSADASAMRANATVIHAAALLSEFDASQNPEKVLKIRQSGTYWMEQIDHSKSSMPFANDPGYKVSFVYPTELSELTCSKRFSETSGITEQEVTASQTTPQQSNEPSPREIGVEDHQKARSVCR
jgi:hypothetical protein